MSNENRKKPIVPIELTVGPEIPLQDTIKPGMTICRGGGEPTDTEQIGDFIMFDERSSEYLVNNLNGHNDPTVHRWKAGTGIHVLH